MGIRRMTFCILACILLAGTMHVQGAKAATVIDKGNCGKASKEDKERAEKKYKHTYIDASMDVRYFASSKLQWTLDSDGVLTVSGKGEMESCPDHYWQKPWSAYAGRIKRVVLEEGVTSIGAQMFQKCKNLKEIQLPDTLKVIENYAFAGCVKLQGIKIPSSVSDCRGGAFKNCKKLKHIEFSDREVWWGEECFAGCSSLKKVKLPVSATWWGDRVFADCIGLNKVILPENISFRTQKWKKETFGFGIKYFKKRKRSSGEYMFEGCTSLKKVVFPKKMKIIPAGFLKGCTSLKGAKLPKGVAYLGWYPYNEEETVVTLPESVKVVSPYCFYGYSYLEDVVFPLGLQKLGDDALSGSGIKEVVIPEGIKVGRGVFSECENLKYVQLPADLKKIRCYTFFGCVNLEEVVMGEEIQEIEDRAFSGCSSLTAIRLPDGIKEIDEEVFSGCTSLSSISWSPNLTYIAYEAFKNCHGLQKLELPEGIEEIGIYAFDGCTGLKKVKLPDGLKELQGGVFINCVNLEEVVFPQSLRRLGSQLFYGCGKLEKIIIKSEKLKKISGDLFEENSKDIVIYVPKGKIEKYKELFQENEENEVSTKSIIWAEESPFYWYMTKILTGFLDSVTNLFPK